MPRNATEWDRKPNLPPTHYVDSRIYTDEMLFEEEREKIFEKVWSLVCHESEVPNAYDFRRCQHMSGKELLVIRGKDMKIRTFYNQCPHRGKRAGLRAIRKCQTDHLHLSPVVVRHQR